MKTKIFLAALGICSIVSSCDETVSAPELGREQTPSAVTMSNKQIVPIEDALTKLESFMSSVDDVSVFNTRGGVKKRIASVDMYYNSAPATRSDDTVPDAYIINFPEWKVLHFSGLIQLCRISLP